MGAFLFLFSADTTMCSFFLAGGWIIGNSFSEAGREWNAKVEIERFLNGGGA